ncbi:MAG: hypothetical protein OER88_06435 [Planctomycetota bacterium]|nr:hypothetical protein [Planctomycetota bacterium]
MKKSLLFLLALAGGVAFAQDKQELTPYSVVETDAFIEAFKRSYNKKGVPEDDANSVLADLKNAYRYFESKGEGKSKDEGKAQQRIVKMITKGLKARKRPRVTLECVRVLGEIGDAAASKDVARWLEKALDEKSIIPEWIEYGFKSMAWIGVSDKRSLDLVIKYGTGKHTDESVSGFALAAAYEYKTLKGKTRKDTFKTLAGWMQGTYSSAKGGDPKKRATYEKRYDAAKTNGLKALNELATYQLTDPPTAFKDPHEAMKWFKTMKNKRWPDYVGPRFRTKAKAAPKDGAKPKDGDKEPSKPKKDEKKP